jgi:hypothetical protein
LQLFWVGPSSREKSELKLVVTVTAKLTELTSKDVKPTIAFLNSETPCFGTETETFVEI